MDDFDDLKLGKVVYRLFSAKSNILTISITQLSRKLNFQHHTPKNDHFRKWSNRRFRENIGFVGLKSKFLVTAKNYDHNLHNEY